MTIEHKILTLVDRGSIHVTDMCSLVGDGAKKEGKRMHDRGLMRTSRPDSPYLTLTPDGVRRLNFLDEEAFRIGMH